MDAENQASFSGWAKVEVMGHQSHIGFVKTEAYGGTVLFRIDTPELPARDYVLEEPAYVKLSGGESCYMRRGAKVQREASQGVSVLVGAGSIYRICPCTEAAALKAIEASVRGELKLIEPPPDRALTAGADVAEDIDGPDDAGDGDDEDDEDDEEGRF